MFCAVISITPQLLAVTAPVSHQYLHLCHGVLMTEGHLLCVGSHADGFCVCSHVIPRMDVGSAELPHSQIRNWKVQVLKVTMPGHLPETGRTVAVTYMSVIS